MKYQHEHNIHKVAICASDVAGERHWNELRNELARELSHLSLGAGFLPTRGIYKELCSITWFAHVPETRGFEEGSYGLEGRTTQAHTQDSSFETSQPILSGEPSFYPFRWNGNACRNQSETTTI